MQFKEINIWDNKEAIQPLLVHHHQELATHKELMVLDPDYATYQKLQLAGRLFFLAMYDGDFLVGYSANAIAPHAHYQGLTVSSNDVIYILPPYRTAGWGDVLRAKTKELAKAKGAQMQLWHAKPGTALDSIMIAQGVSVQDIIYSEVL